MRDSAGHSIVVIDRFPIQKEEAAKDVSDSEDVESVMVEEIFDPMIQQVEKLGDSGGKWIHR